MRVFLPVAIAGVTLATVAVPAANANLIANPGFTGAAEYNRSINADYYWTTPNPIPSWSDDSAPFDLIIAPGGGNTLPGGFAITVPPGFASPTDGNYVALDGDPGLHGDFSQTISGLVTGDKYTLSFYFGAAQEVNRTSPTTEEITATLGDQVFDTNTISIPAQGFSTWQLESFTFVYDGAGALLSFLANGTPSGEPPTSLFSDPSLTAVSAVPEPASATLLLGGIAALGWLRRRKATRARAATT
jgi:hypothetical protein